MWWTLINYQALWLEFEPITKRTAALVHLRGFKDFSQKKICYQIYLKGTKQHGRRPEVKHEEERGGGWLREFEKFSAMEGEREGGWLQGKQCWVVPVAPRLPTHQHQPVGAFTFTLSQYHFHNLNLTFSLSHFQFYTYNFTLSLAKLGCASSTPATNPSTSANAPLSICQIDKYFFSQSILQMPFCLEKKLNF